MQFEFTPYNHRLNPEFPLEVSENYLEQMKKRRSVREFSSSPIQQELLLNAIATAGTAPSGANSQPWHFALIQTQELKDQIRKAAEKVENQFYNICAPEKWLNDLRPLGTNEHKPYLSEAPALIAVFTRQAKFDQMSYYPLESTGISVGLLLSSLHLSGLSTLTHTPRPMRFMNDLLDLDESYRAFMLIVVGYPKPNTLIPDIKKKTLSEFCSVY